MNELTIFDGMKAEIAEFIKPVLVATVTDQATSEKAVITLKQVSLLRKRLESTRKAWTDPLNAKIKQAISIEKEIGRVYLPRFETILRNDHIQVICPDFME